MEYIYLVNIYQKLESTTKRLEKTYHISELLKNTSADDLPRIVLLLQGKVFPAWDERKIGIASRLVLKAINIATGISADKIEEHWKKTGDLGETAESLVGKKKQKTLFNQNLKVKKVFDNLQKLATLEGLGTVDRKMQLIAELLTSAQPEEAKYIVRTLLEELRVGVADGTMRDAIAWASFPVTAGIFSKCKKCKKWMPATELCISCSEKLETKYEKAAANFDEKKALRVKDVSELRDIEKYDFILAENEKAARDIYNYFSEIVQKAYDVSNDFGLVAKVAKEQGRGGLLNMKLQVTKPVKVMLYQKAKGIEDAFETVGKPAALEYKYDGFRLQVHRKGNSIKLFTRRLEDVTKQFPDVVEVVKKNIKADNYILDCETIGIDPKTKKWKPFQEISQRIKRKYDIEKLTKDVPVIVNFFDAMEIDDENLINTPFKERRDKLKKIIHEDPNKIRIAKQIITDNPKEAEKFYKEALALGNEGIMVKGLDMPYKPGSRVGYGVKVKPVMETLDLVIVGAQWGEGKRASWLSSFEIACRDEETGNLLEIGRVGTGIKELEESEGVTFEKLTEMLKPLIISEKGKEVRVKPEIVIEVTYEEIQKSPTYASGYALRFPRLLRIRDDKPADESSTIDLVEELYGSQRGK